MRFNSILARGYFYCVRLSCLVLRSSQGRFYNHLQLFHVPLLSEHLSCLSSFSTIYEIWKIVFSFVDLKVSMNPDAFAKLLVLFLFFDQSIFFVRFVSLKIFILRYCPQIAFQKLCLANRC